jgi:cysteine desulfuration protein SufE
MDIEELIENFEYLDDWEERYGYIIELGKKIDSLDEKFKTEENKVKGCTSQVWIISEVEQENGENTIIKFKADSDAHIVRGLIKIALLIFSEKTAKEIFETKTEEIFQKLGLDTHLSPSRRNGLVSMVEKIKNTAKAYL